MCLDDNNKSNCMANILEKILMLQQRKEDCDDITCTKPFLGPNNILGCPNTRLISFYSCSSNTFWSMPYTLGETTDTSSVFRVESIDDNCATFRILAPNPDATSTSPYLATNDFFTIKLCCIGVLRCLGDTTITGV